MKFIIEETSSWDNLLPALEDTKFKDLVKKEFVTRVDRRTVKSLNEAMTKHWYEDWLNSTTNHREEKGMIAGDRINKVEVNTIEVDSLDHLMDLVTSCGGRIVIELVGDTLEIDKSIEIYNYYRE